MAKPMMMAIYGLTEEQNTADGLGFWHNGETVVVDHIRKKHISNAEDLYALATALRQNQQDCALAVSPTPTALTSETGYLMILRLLGVKDADAENLAKAWTEHSKTGASIINGLWLFVGDGDNCVNLLQFLIQHSVVPAVLKWGVVYYGFPNADDLDAEAEGKA